MFCLVCALCTVVVCVVNVVVVFLFGVLCWFLWLCSSLTAFVLYFGSGVCVVGLSSVVLCALLLIMLVTISFTGLFSVATVVW